MRALLLQDSDECDIILVAHHTVVDGMSIVFIMRDLMQALSGKKLEVLPVPASQEQRYMPVSLLSSGGRTAAAKSSVSE